MLQCGIKRVLEVIWKYWKMCQRRIKSALEVTWKGCYNEASRASWKLLEKDVTAFEKDVATQHQERLGSYLKRMSQRLITMLQRSSKSVLEVNWKECHNVWKGCYNVASRASWKLLERGCCNVASGAVCKFLDKLRKFSYLTKFRTCKDVRQKNVIPPNPPSQKRDTRGSKWW